MTNQLKNKQKMKQIDLFGNQIESNSLREKYIEPPFSVLDAKTASWQKRKKKWRLLGIESEVGRDTHTIHLSSDGYKENDNAYGYTSIFDPVLCELMYNWFCDKGGVILDPFCGGSVRGVVAGYSGYSYVGIDIREEQISSNIEQRDRILGERNNVSYICNDSNIELDNTNGSFDMIFSCPPYADLEVYSDKKGDISNMNYEDFLVAYKSIIKKSCEKLKDGKYAVFVVGEVRDKNGNFYGFVPDTIRIFLECGMKFYNEAIYLQPIASASMRANGNMKSKKLAKIHQNILVFKK